MVGGEFVRRVIALDPMIDQALGRNPGTRAPTRQALQTAVYSLIRDPWTGWQGVARRLS